MTRETSEEECRLEIEFYFSNEEPFLFSVFQDELSSVDREIRDR